jgi:hypothetical protein
VPDRRVFRPFRAGLNRPDHCLARVHADTDFHRRIAGFAQARGVLAHLFLHPQRGVKRALRMVFVRDGRAEQGENAVAGRLDDVAVVAMRRADHQRERRIDDRARLFGIQVLEQIH